jgi:hypothetical protein
MLQNTELLEDKQYLCATPCYIMSYYYSSTRCLGCPGKSFIASSLASCNLAHSVANGDKLRVVRLLHSMYAVQNINQHISKQCGDCRQSAALNQVQRFQIVFDLGSSIFIQHKFYFYAAF